MIKNPLVGLIVMFIGLGLLITFYAGFSPFVFLFSYPTFQTYTIAENVGINSTSLNIPFNFSKSYILKDYDISNGEIIKYTYLNIYIDDFLNNESTGLIPTLKLNNNEFQPVNRTYEYSLDIPQEGLNRLNQNLTITKSSDTVINRIEMSYYGSEYANTEIIEILTWFITIVLFLLGISMI